jgi:drug/metabolite transporter (DMT)-like permease
MIGEIAAVGSALCWAISANFYTKALSERQIGVIAANAIRCIPGTLILGGIALFSGEFYFLKNVGYLPLLFIFLGTLIGLGIGDSLYFKTLRYIGASRTVPITCIYPLFTILFTFLFLKEQVTLLVIGGAITIAVGIWMISKREHKEQNRNMRLGILLGILTAILWGSGMIFFKSALEYVSPFLAAVLRLVILTPLLLVFCSLKSSERKWLINLDPRLWLLLGAAGALALALGGTLFFYGLDLIGTTRAVPLSSVAPLFTPILATLWLKEKITLKTLAGIILTTFGIILVAIA